MRWRKLLFRVWLVGSIAWSGLYVAVAVLNSCWEPGELLVDLSLRPHPKYVALGDLGARLGLPAMTRHLLASSL